MAISRLREEWVPCTSQPQGYCEINRSSQLLQGTTPLVITVGGLRFNLVDNKPLKVQGSGVTGIGITSPCPGGVGHYSGAAPGSVLDFGADADSGTSPTVDFWYGMWSAGSSGANQYVMGDYNGTTGGGVAAFHTGISGQWGYYDVPSGLTGSGFSLTNGKLYCFVVVKAGSGGVLNVYLDGVARVTLGTSGPSYAPWAVGAIGQNQSVVFNTQSYTLLAGRLKGRAWTVAEVRAFAENPWNILLDRQLIPMPATGAGSAPGAIPPATFSLLPGAATGQIAGSAAGATVTSLLTLLPGAATAGTSGNAPGDTVTSLLTLLPGGATGAASAPGATATAVYSVLPGVASSTGSGVAPGATTLATFSLLPGAATGQLAGSAPGATVTSTLSLLPGAAVSITPGGSNPFTDSLALIQLALMLRK